MEGLIEGIDSRGRRVVGEVPAGRDSIPVRSLVEIDLCLGWSSSGGEARGAMGEVEMSAFKFEIDADLFGPTTIVLGVNVALGLQTSTEAAVAIDFTEIYLAGATEFRKVGSVLNSV